MPGTFWKDKQLLDLMVAGRGGVGRETKHVRLCGGMKLAGCYLPGTIHGLIRREHRIPGRKVGDETGEVG